MSEFVLTDQPAAAVRRITINRPDKRNALGAHVRDQLMPVFADALADPEVRAIILTGAEGTFCSGGDISTMSRMEAPVARARMKASHRFVRQLAEAEKPIVAAVEGHAAGAGAGLTLLCDLVVLGEGAQISFPFFRIGLVPDYGILYNLPRRAGMGIARQALLLGTPFRGREAVQAGLADLAVPDAQVQDEALRVAQELASRPRHAIALAKQLLRTMPDSLDGALEMEALAQAVCFTGEEFVEGSAAFLAKRKPKF